MPELLLKEHWSAYPSQDDKINLFCVQGLDANKQELDDAKAVSTDIEKENLKFLKFCS